MKQALDFVRGAVSRTDLVPVLTTYRIADGSITASNGNLWLSHPLDVGFEAAPVADAFYKALSNCTDAVSLTLDTKDRRLVVADGTLQVRVPCVALEDWPAPPAEPDAYELDGAELLRALTVLQPFVGIDASRPHYCGVLFRGNSAFATNNVTVAQYWVGFDCLGVDLLLPAALVAELLRIGQPPSHMTAGPGTITFHYHNGASVRASQLAGDKWADLEGLLDEHAVPAGSQAVPDGMPAALDKLKPFLADSGCVYLEGDTAATDGTAPASVSVAGLGAAKCMFNHTVLVRMVAAAASINWGLYPKPVAFFTEQMRGVAMGMRV